MMERPAYRRYINKTALWAWIGIGAWCLGCCIGIALGIRAAVAS